MIDIETGQKWRHKKRGTVYEIVSTSASIQCATAPEFEKMFEEEWWVVYRNTTTNAIWVRLFEEFMDGRFERVE